MRFSRLHSWKLTPKEAVALQRELAGKIDTRRPLGKCNLIAGADVSYSRFSNILYAGVVVLRMDDLSIVEKSGVVREVSFPYIPGLLSFRETPVVLEAFARLKTAPDAVMIDGHGFSHPRRFGYACHVGLWLGLPTVGCAKSLLVGEYETPGLRAGSTTPLVDKEEMIGQVLRTKDAIKPVFMSVGNKINIQGAVKLAVATCTRYRIPEPTRQAHLHVNLLRQEAAC